LTLGLVTPALASPITGSITIQGGPASARHLSTQTAITNPYYNSPIAAVGQQTGLYNVLPTGLPVIFLAPTTTNKPFWMFTYLGRNYSLDTTSLAAVFDAGSNTWSYNGRGILRVTGYEDTAAAWSFSSGSAGHSFDFKAAAASAVPIAPAPLVPETSAVVVLLGLGLAGVLGVRRHSRLSA